MKKVVKKKWSSKTFSKLFLIFFVGCIAGWIYEEIFYYVAEGIIVNRGFLYGPYLPVYGLGALLIYLLLNRFKKVPILVFLLSFVITGVVEYLTGFWMWEVYHKRWWDYTGLFLNIGGHVCFRSLVSFSVGALILIYAVVPLMDKIIKKIGDKKCLIFSITASIIMIFDLIITLLIRH